jgi:hypothetical protein
VISCTPARDPPAHNPPARNPAARDPAARDPAARDPAARDPAARDPAARDPPAAVILTHLTSVGYLGDEQGCLTCVVIGSATKSIGYHVFSSSEYNEYRSRSGSDPLTY